MSACSDVPFMLPLSWRPGTRHCICQPDRTRAAPSLKEPFICGEEGGAGGERRKGEGKEVKTERLVVSVPEESKRRSEPGRSQQSASTTGIRNMTESYQKPFFSLIRLQAGRGGCSWRCGRGEGV